MSIETNPANKKAPKISLQYPLGWRITLWSLIGAWHVSWIMLGMLALVSLSIGMLSLFAGSLWGFCVFALPKAGWYILGFGPPILLVAYIILCARLKPEKKPASIMNRMLAAVLGFVIAISIVAGLFSSMLSNADDYQKREACMGQKRS